ncbi:Phosphoenolpyruvate synthase [Ephemeroptericola cinctiostellae]|uniref:Phosphoenolpyruvate synthase n=1 Tax=Ephemeroptericola cinctiostellae TaxID=2268024 RepID=A0A345DCH0_9BURK|nr:PEP/pyruvate-binding domain-containing protein [Ephemeroptericola cinctiostellae]AXF86058.1 Phosphoenolpyruvate synthase [Ephemeroptericola cinctiostellae]
MHNRLFNAIAITCAIGLNLTPAFAQQRVWQPTVSTSQDWQALAVNERDAEFSKFILDVKTGRMYFIDAHVFKLHIDFGLGVLLKKPRTYESIKSFNLNYSADKPQFILGYLTHYPKLSLWTYSFWEGDAIRARDVIKTQRALQKTFFIPNLTFRPDSLAQETMAKQLKKSHLPVITNDKIYQKLPFQAFQTGEAIGTLRIVPPSTALDTLNFADSDIVVLQEAYPDISPVAGIITTQFSTPLAHVNLRATAWGIPNAGDKTAATEFAPLNNRIVHYRVTEQGLTLRAATDSEIEQFKARRVEDKHVNLPAIDEGFNALTPLTQIRASEVNRFGTKTANLGEIVHANATTVNVPTGFGIPFHAYIEHITANHLQPKIDATLNDARFTSDPVWRRDALSALRQTIVDAPMNPQQLARIERAWQKQLGGKGVFVRSSTNAEDLKGFNGAGLYDTVPNVATHEALEPAIKKVWASIWNERAVNERQFAGIDHRQVYPAVLIQTGVNATAAGVLLTTDIWGHNPNTYTINAKWGLGIRVVEGQKIPEQILYDTSNNGTRIISRSNETSMLVFDPKNGVREVPTPAGDTILTEARAKRLGETVDVIVPLFSRDTALDIEWVLEGEKIWIVQARPYVSKVGKNELSK